MFGRVIPRERFGNLWNYLLVCAKDNHGTKQNQPWSPVTELVEAFSSCREQNATPSETLCIEETMSRWYDLEGDWPIVGLPHYVSIDRKPESGFEIWTTCCGRSGIMILTKLVKGVSENKSIVEDERLNLSTAEALEMVRPWFNSGRVVIADPWFASVSTAIHLFTFGMKFIGIVRHSSSQYPKAESTSIVVSERGRYVPVVNRDEQSLCDLDAVVWTDSDR